MGEISLARSPLNPMMEIVSQAQRLAHDPVRQVAVPSDFKVGVAFFVRSFVDGSAKHGRSEMIISETKELSRGQSELCLLRSPHWRLRLEGFS
jgi:hypothetical protein